MLRQRLLFLVLGLSACDEFFKDGSDTGIGDCLEGFGDSDAFAEEAFDRANWYREQMGLNSGVLDPLLNDSAQTHAAYMYDDGAISHQESSDGSCYTGEWVWDRMDAVGYERVAGSTWSEVVAYGFDPTGSVDGWMGTVYHRVPFSMARWSEVGFGQADVFSSMSFVTSFPAGVNLAVIYPADGLTDVPTSFDSNQEIPDPAPDHGVVGYPITVTVGADTVVSDSVQNPYGLELLDWSLRGPSGSEVDVLVADPNADDMLVFMASMLPIEPLMGGTEYEAEMTVRWNGMETTLYSAFTTATD
jgi:hypothetical protein